MFDILEGLTDIVPIPAIAEGAKKPSPYEVEHQRIVQANNDREYSDHVDNLVGVGDQTKESVRPTDAHDEEVISFGPENGQNRFLQKHTDATPSVPDKSRAGYPPSLASQKKRSMDEPERQVSPNKNMLDLQPFRMAKIVVPMSRDTGVALLASQPIRPSLKSQKDSVLKNADVSDKGAPPPSAVQTKKQSNEEDDIDKWQENFVSPDDQQAAGKKIEANSPMLIGSQDSLDEDGIPGVTALPAKVCAAEVDEVTKGDTDLRQINKEKSQNLKATKFVNDCADKDIMSCDYFLQKFQEVRDFRNAARQGVGADSRTSISVDSLKSILRRVNSLPNLDDALVSSEPTGDVSSSPQCNV